MDHALLTVEGLCVGLDRGKKLLPAVADVSFEIRSGQALGLVGESGSGKSLTALALLQLLPEPAARIVGGSIRLRGQELVGASSARLQGFRGVDAGMVFQDPMTSLNPVLTVGDQIEEPLRCRKGLRRGEARSAAVEALRSVGLPSPERIVEAYPHQLSGGMRQRALIAAALCCNPALLVADEPTTALDVTVQAQILALLDRERRRRGLGLLLISHDLGVIARTCDEVAVMYAGRIVERGPVGKVFEAPAHRYTAGLLRSVAALADSGHPRQPLPVIPGMVPPADRFGEPGCPFRDRCGSADSRCETSPDWTQAGDRGFACHHPGNVP
jgi:oligopeptide/dipeptide ABC transporter ATP-binding protein